MMQYKNQLLTRAKKIGQQLCSRKALLFIAPAVSNNYNNMKKYKLIGLLLVAVTLLGFKQTDPYSKISKHNVSLEYPSNWDKMDAPGYAFILKERATSDQPSVLTNFAVEIDENYNNLKEYSTFWKNKMSKNEYLSNWKLTSENKIKYKSYKAKEFICTYEVDSFKVKTRVIIVVVNDEIINLNTTSSLESFKNKKEITDRIYNSVKIIK
jgi:hypothetical protein